MKKRPAAHPLLLAIIFALFGILIGTGGYTFIYAKGYSYLSNDPQACVNCHIMRGEYDGWQKASHHGAATCNDCHVPHALIPKYLTKAENGYAHSRAFTFQDFHEPIEMRDRSKQIVLDNCIECHKQMVSNLTASAGTFSQNGTDIHRGQVDCIQCHRGVGHGTTD